jgi:uncharacterized protein YidB (DUF937 family)
MGPNFSDVADGDETGQAFRKARLMLDAIIQSVLKETGAPAGANPLTQALGALLQDSQSGGLPGMLSKLAQGGLGSAVDSWVSTGPNQPVTGQALQQALGSDLVKGLAAKSGLPLEQMLPQLAALLPGVVDKLTPDGKLPDMGGLLQQGLGILKGLNR